MHFFLVPILVSFLAILSHGSALEPIIIGVPGRASFPNFVKITPTENPNEKNYTGFCIQLFEKVKAILGDQLPPHKFVEYNGSYEELVDSVANKTIFAAVGDVTILAKRWQKVDFSEPFTESGLTMVVPLKPKPKAWIFLEPFTLGMWLASGAVLVYTMFVVWFLEHRSNPEFGGPWRDQLGNALWFTFTSLFQAHRERIGSNYTRVVVVVWLFVALVLTQSYTASLTSMLTVMRLRPNFVASAKLKVGCDNNPFMNNYVRTVLNYTPEQVRSIEDEDGYLAAFRSENISAALLEIPYAKVFVNKHCRKFTSIGTTYRFGGFGFVFEKGSPYVDDVSEAILRLSEDGDLKNLEEEWLTPNSECNSTDSKTTSDAEDIDRLSFQNFWGLFLFTVATSSACFLLFNGHLLVNYGHNQSRVADESIWNRTCTLAHYLKTAETARVGRARTAHDQAAAAPETGIV